MHGVHDSAYFTRQLLLLQQQDQRGSDQYQACTYVYCRYLRIVALSWAPTPLMQNAVLCIICNVQHMCVTYSLVSSATNSRPQSAEDRPKAMSEPSKQSTGRVPDGNDQGYHIKGHIPYWQETWL